MLKGATWNGDNNFLKVKKHISLVFQFETNMLRNGLSTFKFLNSQKARLRSFLQAGDFILTENIKLINVTTEINCRKNKLLIAIKQAWKSSKMGRETEAGPIPMTGSSR